jgi:hypothetical protein
MANAPVVIVFMLLLVAATIVGTFVLAYVARCILVVAIGTASGQDAVEWPDEPVRDWVGHSAALMGLIFIWLFPAGLLANYLRKVWLPDEPGLRTFYLAVPVLWLFFPIGAFSSLSSLSRWVFFRPLIVSQLFQLFPASLTFYLLSAVVLIAGLLPIGLTIQGNMLYLLGLTAPLAAATVLVYARLLGRLGAMIRARIPFLPEDRSVRKTPKKTQKLPPVRTTPDPNTPFVGEPDHVYDEATKKRALLFEEDGDIMEAYTLSQGTPLVVPETQTPAPTRTRPLDAEELDALQGYEIDTPITPTAPPEPVKKPKLRKKKPPPPPGMNTLFRGVFTFPCYPTSMGAWLTLSFGIAVFSGLLLACRSWFPPGLE